MSAVNKHEDDISCPSCRWSGSLADITSHFQNRHPKYVVEHFWFDIKTRIWSKHDPVRLFRCNGTTFLLHVHYKVRYGRKEGFLNELLRIPDTTTKIIKMRLCLQVAGSEEDARQFMYFVDFVNEDNVVKRFDCQNVQTIGIEDHVLSLVVVERQEELAVEIPDDFRGTFKPTRIVNKLYLRGQEVIGYKIEILQNEHKNLQHLNNTVKRELECQICMEIVTKPIRQCQNGHLLCNSCNAQVQKCPSCRGAMATTRNLFAESVVDQLVRTCRYSASGCSFVSSNVRLKTHEEECALRDVACPVAFVDSSGCGWRGKINEILAHMTIHKDNTLEETLEVVVPLSDVDFAKEDKDCYVFEKHGEVFRLLYKYGEDMFYWAVQLMGPSCDRERFMYVLTIVTEVGSNCQFSLAKPCVKYGEDEPVEGWIECPLSLIRPMIDEYMNLTYQIEILKK